MRKLLISTATGMIMVISGFAAFAGDHAGAWTLDGAASTVAFGSVKKDSVGEAHHFSGLSGSVSADGVISVEIDLTSVETWIDIRNERFIEHVFAAIPKAVFSANVDMAMFAEMAVGTMQEVDIKGTLQMGAMDIAIQETMIAVRLSETRVMVLSAEMIWLSTEEVGIDAGITVLQTLAKLPGITRAFPVTLRLVFDQ